MKKFIIIISLFLSCSFMFSQNKTDSIVGEVIHNNLNLKTLKKLIESKTLENKTGLLPENPELSFGYLRGNPGVLGNRTDISITQSFDFPTAYSYRKQISDLKNEQLIIEYEKEERKLVLKTKLLCQDIIFCNALEKELQKRFSDAKKIERAYQLMLEAGECNMMDYNKVRLNRINAKNELELLKINKTSYLQTLNGLNGNNEIEFNDSVFYQISIPEDFNAWYSDIKNTIPDLKEIEKETEINRKREKLQKAENLPKFEAGYMTENVSNEKFQGVTIGISIPLWENKNKSKYQKIKSEALQTKETESDKAFYNELKTEYHKLVALDKGVREYESILNETDNTAMLLKAFNSGEINLINYLNELSYYYQSVNTLLEMKKELFQTYTILMRYY